MESKGFIIKLADLPKDVVKLVQEAPVSHFLPWRLVFKDGSASTPCRVVVDPLISRLNSTLAKGVNTLNNLQAIHVQFMSDKEAYVIDVGKMYNNVNSDISAYSYQRALWVKDLDQMNEVVEYIFTM